MTKYVINSGGLSNNPKRAKEFIAEIVNGLGRNPTILFCFFATLRENWEVKHSEYTEGFRGWLPDTITPKFELAFPEKFVEQIERSDAIYIHGGDDHLILYWLKQFNLPNIWDGKVVATNSASSNALSTHFWTCDWRKCMNGLGVLPIKFLAHFKSNYGENDPRGPIDWLKAYEDLKAYGEQELPIHALQEGDYLVIER